MFKRIIREMPDFKNMHKLVDYINGEFTKDDDETNPDNLTDPNYERLVAVIKRDALSKFGKKNKLEPTEVANIYKSAKNPKFNFLKEYLHDESNLNYHHNRIAVTDEGRDFLDVTKLFHFKKGKWHAIINYFVPWSLIISLIALAISILVAIFK